MRPTVDQLHSSGRYLLIESFALDDMNHFIVRELGMTPKADQTGPKRGLQRWLPLVGLALIGGVIGYVGGSSLKSQPSGEGGSLLWQIGAAFIGFFILLPIHEFIHGLAFKRVGAPKIGYGYSLKSLMVYAYSQNFPATTRELAFVAALPFVIITAGLLFGWVLLPAYWLFWVILLLIHTSACIGDFVLINYHRKNRHRTIYTYDDVENERKTYFFEEVR
ncbi:DUF3267 domain-containing protein [Spirosoma arcticum]